MFFIVICVMRFIYSMYDFDCQVSCTSGYNNDNKNLEVEKFEIACYM